MRNKIYRYAGVSAVAGILVLAMGCGRAADSPLGAQNLAPGTTVTGSPWSMTTTNCPNELPINLTACTAGYIRIANGTCQPSSATFAQRCQWDGGLYLAAANGLPELCKATIMPLALIGAGVLNPGIPCGGIATGIAVHKGDKLSLTASGGYDPVSSSFFHIYNCSVGSMDVNVDGSGLTNGGLPQGLLGSDGIEIFTVGSNLSNKVINNNGQLHLGLNIPSTTQVYCSALQINNLKVTHCEDPSGNTVSCP